MNSVKKKDQNILPIAAERLLDQIHDIILSYRTEKGIEKGRFATDAGLLKNSLLVIEEKKQTKKGKRSTIDLVTLVKILNQYGDLKTRLGHFFTGNKEEKLTPIHINQPIVENYEERIQKLQATIDSQRATLDWQLTHIKKIESEKDALKAENEALKKQLAKDSNNRKAAPSNDG